MSASSSQEFSGAVENARRTAAGSMAFLRSAAGMNRAGETIPEASNESEPVFGKPTPPSSISANTELVGAIRTPDALEVHGKVDGDVFASTITVCTGGRIKGDLSAETIVVRGTVEGHICARDVRLCAGSNVKGEISAASLGIDTAAIFEGMIKRVEPSEG